MRVQIAKYKQRLQTLERELAERLGDDLATAREAKDDQPAARDQALVDHLKSEYFALALSDAEILDEIRAALERIRGRLVRHLRRGR